MNKLERDILDSEMGLYPNTKPAKPEEKEQDIKESPDSSAEVADDAPAQAYTSDGVQLKIDDLFLGGEEEEEKFFLYGYQDELDLSSLDADETADSSREEKQRDGSGLYREAVIMLETREIDIDNGIALLKKNATEGHALSWMYIGQLYSNKTSVIYNPALAFECYEKAAEQSFGEGYYNLGLCYFRGFGCDKDEERAAECFSEGAKIFNPNCIFALGMCYEFGSGCEINYEYAVTLYEKACELGHAGAANNLGGCYFHGHGVEMDKEKAVGIFKRAVELGSSDALCRLGMIFEEGDGAEQNIKTAFDYYKTSADAKNPIGLYKLGICYDKGLGVEQNFNKAYKCYSRSANLGYAPAKYETGRMCIEGRGTKKNHDAAFDMFLSAAQNGYAPAEYEVANCFLEGLGAMKDRESAYRYFSYAFDSDDKNRAEAAYKLGLCHLKGLGTRKDDEEAFEWFITGAKLGSANAMYMLGECYFFGIGTACDSESAFSSFLNAYDALNAANKDTGEYVSLIIALGHCLERGVGTEPDPVRARKLYKEAAQSGRPDAMYQMGRAILYGVGMKAEYAAARPLFLRSARKGYVPSMLMMGVFSDEGRGVPKNREDAKAWYLKTANSDGEHEMGLYDFPERYSEEAKLYTESKIKAQYRLGMLIARTDRSLNGYTRAFEYVALAASMGYTQAQNEITKIYISGGDLTSYYESPMFAPDSFMKGGELQPDKTKLGNAMNKLGDTFFDGKLSLKKNEGAAARCYRFAAELGDVDASYSYGWCLRHGVGVRENDHEAVKWLKMAADKGNPDAAYSYGLCCEEGAGTGIKNKREALYYYRMAGGSGHREAAQRFLKLSEREE